MAASSHRRPRPLVGLAVVLALVVFAGGVYVYAKVSRGERVVMPLPPAERCEATLEDGRTASLDLEQAQNASLIAGVAAYRRLVPRAVSIALATTFQESGLRNLDYGDLDSLGLFQQRPAAGWGTPEEIMDPYYSTNAFFDAMVKVPGWQDADIGDVAQEVQRSAFPDAYDQHVERARILASALTGETHAAWTCHLRDPLPADPARLAEALTKTYGVELLVETISGQPSDPSATPPPATLAVQATSPEVAWSAAAFAQAWGPEYGVRSVQVGDLTWSGQADVLSGWVGPAASPGSALEPRAVRVSFVP